MRINKWKKLCKPVWDVNVDDAGFQELPLLVSTGHKEPPLVVRQAVSHEEHVVFGGNFCPDLPLLWLLGTGRTEDEGGRVELQRVGVLKEFTTERCSRPDVWKNLTPGSSSGSTPTVGLLRTELTVDAGPKPVRDLM